MGADHAVGLDRAAGRTADLVSLMDSAARPEGAPLDQLIGWLHTRVGMRAPGWNQAFRLLNELTGIVGATA